MASSQIMISLPCYEGYLEFAIWHEEPQSVSQMLSKVQCPNIFFLFQNVSYYGLLSKEPILNPKLIDRKITLPFYPGCRYAALPGTSNHDDAVQVNTYSARPEHLVYHDHSFHLGDIKVACWFVTSLFMKNICCLDFGKDQVQFCTFCAI